MEASTRPPHAQIGPSLRITKATAKPVQGETVTERPANGIQTTWRLHIGGHRELPIWIREWDTGERDVVLGRPDRVPPMPAALDALLGKQRASILRRGRHTVMIIYLVRPDENNHPRRKKCTLEQLTGAVGDDLVRATRQLGVVDIGTKEQLLGDTGRTRTELCGILNPKSETAPVALYVISRVVPTLKKVGWL